MTADRPRLAAAAEAVWSLLDDTVDRGTYLPPREEIRTVLAPHVPERDDCKGQVRLAADLLQLAAQWRRAGASQYGGDESLADLGASPWVRCAEDLVFLLAGHAPEPTGG